MPVDSPGRARRFVPARLVAVWIGFASWTLTVPLPSQPPSGRPRLVIVVALTDVRPSALLNLCEAGRAVGEAEQAVGDAGRAVGEAGRAVGEAGRAVGEAGQAVGEAGRAVGEAEQAVGEAGQAVGEAGQAVGEAGLRRLVREGVTFLNARVEYAITARSAGFATLAAGASPSVHGIVGDAWIVDRPPRRIRSWEDPDADLVVPGARVPVTDDAPGVGPRALEVSTLSDALVSSSRGKAKSWSVGTTAAGAVFTAGRLGKAVWIGEQGLPTSSVRYFPQRGEFPPRLPRWLDELAVARGWRTLPAEGLSPAERIDRVTEIAAALIAQEGLGADEVSDLLHIGLDLEGAWVGRPAPKGAPRGATETSAWGAIDRLVERLLGLQPEPADKSSEDAAAADWTLVLVGVRGSAPPPPRDAEAPREVVHASSLARSVERHLDRVIRPLDWVLATTPSGLWLHPQSILASGCPASEVQQLAASVAEDDPHVLIAIPAATAAQAQRGAGSIPDLARRSLHGTRFPDVLVVPRPYVLWQDDSGTASSDGPELVAAVSESPHTYDTHVPLIVLRPGLDPRSVLRRVSLEDVAPTLALLLRSDLPSGSQGEPLVELGPP